jgi:hypothetical protein
MATSIAFGLAFSTFLVLLLVPTLLLIYERGINSFRPGVIGTTPP